MKALLFPGRALASRRSLGLLILLVLIIARVFDPAPVEELRLRTFDLFQNLQPRSDQFRPVVIVDIDETSLSAYGQWPWPRTLIADLVTRLFELQSVAVAFDVIFAEPDRTSPAEAMKYFRNVDDVTRARLLGLPSNDDVLATAISRGKVVLGQAGTRAVASDSKASLPETGIAILGPDPRPYLIGFPGLLNNIPQLEVAAAGRGLFTIAAERDGMVRRVPLILKAGEKVVPALSVELLRVASGAGAVLVRSDQAGVRNVGVSGLDLPTDENGRVWVHFSSHDATRYVSAKDVIEGTASAEKFAGKLVLIGTSAIGLLDIKTTPVHPTMPGVEIHAQLLEGALTKSLLQAPASAVVFELFASVAAALVLIALAPVAGALTLLLTATVSAAAFLTGSWILYSKHQMLLDPTFPLITLFSVYLSLALVGYLREQSDRRRIRSAFSQYLGPALVEQLASSPKKLVLGGEIRNMTVLFSDVRGFTAISEGFSQDPAGLTALMNRLLTPLTKTIVGRHGTIDKYIGDAIMAFWNAPLDDPSHESDACSAALEMIQGVSALNHAREQESFLAEVTFVPIKIGIGVNTGSCVVGNMGSDMRFQYTAMGDTVNLASRLEGQTAVYGVPLLIGAKTAEAVADRFALLQVDRIRVKGKQTPEAIYTIVGGGDTAKSDDFNLLRDRWNRLLDLYRSQQWSGVIELADPCSLYEKFELRQLAELYRNRSREFSINAPPIEWDGVFTATVKSVSSSA